MNAQDLKAGDVITFKDGRQTLTVRLTRQPEWNDHWKRWYVGGHRFIKSRQTFSGSALLYNFAEFTKVEV